MIAEDDVVKERLEKEVYPSNQEILKIERSKLELDPSAHNYETKAYQKMVSGRATHILQKLQAGFNVIYCDVDSVWRSSPLPYIEPADKVDMILQVDINNYFGHPLYYCTGFMAIVSNNATAAFIKDWQKSLETPQLNQPIFNDILYKRSVVRHQGLPKPEFPSGGDFFSRHYTPEMLAKAVVVHNNYIIGHDPKKKRFVNHQLWKISDN